MNQVIQKRPTRRCRIFSDSFQFTNAQPQVSNIGNRVNSLYSEPLNYGKVDRGSKQNVKADFYAKKARLSESRHKIFSLRGQANYYSIRQDSIDRESKAQSCLSSKIKRRHKIFEDWKKQSNKNYEVSPRKHKLNLKQTTTNKNQLTDNLQQAPNQKGLQFSTVQAKQAKKQENHILSNLQRTQVEKNSSLDIMDPYQFEQLLRQTRRHRQYKRKLIVQSIPQQTHKLPIDVAVSPFHIYNLRQPDGRNLIYKI